MNSNIEHASVSAIIPCYNSTKTLERAVVSVWEQILRPKELILVDDGSTDNGKTVGLMYHLRKKYGKDWIIIIELGADLGVSTARNTGWENATQKYVAFLDSDDAWHLEKILIQYRLMEDNPHYVMSGHDYEIIRDPMDISKLKGNYTVKDYSFNRMLLKNLIVTPSMMICRDSKIKFQLNRNDYEDHLLWLEVANTYGPALKIDLPLTFLFKSEWGEGGLNSRHWIMEKGRMKNYLYLYKMKIIGFPIFSILMLLLPFRLLKRLFTQYIVRRFISYVRNFLYF